MAAPTSYCAFISYSHRDETFARWLHRRLESWRVPAELEGQPSPLGPVPRHLRPVFRDRDDFSGGASLKEATVAALGSARSLIVICSPNAARSRYVNEEIALFRSLVPGAPIVPIILSGTPGGAQDECFPDALRYPDGPGTAPVEPIAPDARDEGDGRQRAFAKLIAGLLAVPSDAILKREEQARRRRRAWLAGAVAGAAAFATAFASFALYQSYQATRTIEKSVFAIGGIVQETERLAADGETGTLRQSMLRQECDVMDGLARDGSHVGALESAICFYERAAISADQRAPGETLGLMCARRDETWAELSAKAELTWDEAALAVYVVRRTAQAIVAAPDTVPPSCGKAGDGLLGHLRHGLDLLDQIGRKRPDFDEARAYHDATLWEALAALETAGDWSGSLAAMRTAVALRAVQEGVSVADGVHPATFDRALYLRRIAWLLRDHLKNPAEALVAAEESVAAWAALDQTVPLVAYQSALAHTQKADALHALGRLAEARPALEAAKAHAEAAIAGTETGDPLQAEARDLVLYLNGRLTGAPPA